VPTALVLELEKRNRQPVVLFENPIGFDLPVVTNLFGSRERIARMVNAAPNGFNDKWTKAQSGLVSCEVAGTGPVQAGGSDRGRDRRGAAADQPPFREGRRPLHRLRRPDCKDPDTGVRNLSYQRMQLKGRDRFGASLHSRGHIWSTWNAAGPAAGTSRSRW